MRGRGGIFNHEKLVAQPEESARDKSVIGRRSLLGIR
jgi:hypothetical protein